MSDFLWPHGLVRQAPLSIDSPGKNTGMGCYFFLQGYLPTQGLNPHLFPLLHWQTVSLPLSHLGSAITQFLTTLSNSAMIMGVQISLWDSDLISFRYIYPEVGWLLFLIFWGTSIPFSRIAILTYIPSQPCMRVLFFFASLLTCVIFWLFDKSS